METQPELINTKVELCPMDTVPLAPLETPVNALYACSAQAAPTYTPESQYHAHARAASM
jgi:hypothetical protein